MAPPSTTGDALSVVRQVLEAWSTADDVERSVSLRQMGDTPEPGAVPYAWVKWQGLKMLRGEYHARYNAIRRAVLRLNAAGIVTTWSFEDNGQLAWVIVTNSCNNAAADGTA